MRICNICLAPIAHKEKACQECLAKEEAPSLSASASGSVYSSVTTAHQFQTPPTYHWEPKEDITPFEIAMCLPVFAAGLGNWNHIGFVYAGLPAEAQRHWRVVPYGTQNAEGMPQLKEIR